MASRLYFEEPCPIPSQGFNRVQIKKSIFNQETKFFCAPRVLQENLPSESSPQKNVLRINKISSLRVFPEEIFK